MKVGANYTPRRGWFHSWIDLDEREVAADFRALASIGLDHVRLFPLWPLLQPSRGLVVGKAVDDLMRVVDLAGEQGLEVSVDCLNGHLSSYDFVPSWLVSWHERNLFTDPDVVAAEGDLVEAIAGELSTRPHGTGICLGNEFPQFAAPRHPRRSVCTSQQADVWLAELLGRAEKAFPGGHHVHCFDDEALFLDEHPFTAEHAVTRGAATTVHSWVFGGLGQRFGVGHPSLTAFSRYLVELVNGWSPEADRPVWLQEVGAPINYVPVGKAADFLRETLSQVMDAPNLEAVTWWCSHDVSRSLPDFPELEYSLGLLDSEGRVKLAGRQLAEMVPQLREATPRTSAPSVLDFAPDITRRHETNVNSALFDAWLDRHLDGETPALRAAR